MVKHKESNTQHIQRKFKPTYMALKNKTTVYILTGLLVFFGLFSYNQMPRELMPEVVVPYIFVQTVYPGNSPVDIENLITRPIEQELKGLQGVKKVSSASYQDVSTVIVEFNTNVTIKQALQDTKDRVDKAKSELPGDLQQDPVVMDIDLSEFPIMNVNLSGDFSMRDLKKYAEILQDEFESLNEISEANIRGIEEREIQINVDPHKLDAVGLTFEDIAFAIQFENITMGAGEFTADQIRRIIRTEADYKNVEQIANTIIKINMGNPVYIRDVANVVDGYKEKSTIARLNDKPVVSLSITKKSGENILDASEKILNTIESQKENGYLPQNLEVTTTDDMSHYIRNEIKNLENSIILGMILVIFVLFLFLGFRNALFSGLAIPMSMFLSFIILQQTGVTLNNMVLYGLILALGMLVDNAIVVVENVYRLYSLGYSSLEATKKGVSEIAMPIVSSTLTTLAAFVPLLMWEGMVGQFMSILPKTLIVVLASSLFVALILNPAFVSTFIKIDNINTRVNWKKSLKRAGIYTIVAVLFYLAKIYLLGNILMTIVILTVLNFLVLRPLARWFQTKFLVWLENFYSRQLRFALTGYRPLIYFIGTILLLIFSAMFYFGSQPNVVFFPNTDPQTIYVTMELPIGTSIEKTDQVSREIEKIINETIEPVKPIIKSVTTSVGSGKGGMFENESSPNKSLTSISFEEYQFREGISTGKIMQQIATNLDGFVGAKIFVEKEDNGPPTGPPVNIDVSGDEFNELIRITDDFIRIIEEDNIPGIDELKLNINVNQPEMLVKVDREKARLFELSTQQIAMAFRNALYGYEASKFKDGEDEYDIFIRLDEKYRNDVSTLLNQKLIINDNKIPISAVADFEYSTTYDKISRIDNKRVITISSNVVEGYNANQINERIRQMLADYEMPNGYNYAFTGEQQEQDESSAFLLFALLIAIAIIMIILVTQFNSFIRPAIIIATVIFSTIGVFLGLGIFNMEFVIIMTGIGIISLAGIVVNNGIVLIDYIDLLRKRKREELGLPENGFLPTSLQLDALVEAGRTRLRPVLLTAITTVLGLLPLAIGFNFDFFGLYTHFDPNFSLGGESVAFWGPMSWTVIFGLTFATFLTLLISPVMYMLTIRINYRIRKWTGNLPKENIEIKAVTSE
ncbi:MAG: efflux RND transporter permease subunit [Prolixibacteraceae bacterium]|jgi:multidrug efflux pump|nr:efflux RND transporter permease subunit [Prolixibacteraceae bacterium]MBT6764969.1 efflux RND transporter permease subunit [Prolixibacteraceae bacterium]MBT6997082.1 efflux RND transporter permease subunit [Prolixibacteraceae bacterium]MBT7393385.1 efflux RND transporter permease subunit [Prolixibacteraceae bacterium]